MAEVADPDQNTISKSAAKAFDFSFEAPNRPYGELPFTKVAVLEDRLLHYRHTAAQVVTFC